MFQLETGSIDDQPRRGLGDDFHFDKVMRLQRVAGFDQIHDPIGQTDERRQFNRSIQLDDFDRHSALIEIPLGDLRILGGDPNFRGEPVA